MNRATQGELRRQAPIVRALCEALERFGPTTPENQAEIARWVRKRTAQLEAKPEPFDVKEAAAGEAMPR